jgi:hypothetical protein
VQRPIELGEAPVSLNVLTQPNDAIREGDIRLASPKLAYLEARARLAACVETVAIAPWCEEHMIAAFDDLGEVGIDFHHRASGLELPRAKILEPVLRALHTMEQSMAAAGEWDDAVLHARRERTVGIDVPFEIACIRCRVAGLTKDANVIGKAEHTHTLCSTGRSAGLAPLRMLPA